MYRASPPDEELANAHARLLEDQSLQFDRAGFSPPEVPAWLRWIPDALMILRQDAARIDWDRLVEASRRARMLNRLGLALGFLHETFDGPVPASVLRDVGRSSPTLVERLENQRILGRMPGPVGMYCYKAAVLIRMMMSGPRRAIPGLLWLKIMQHVPANRA